MLLVLAFQRAFFHDGEIQFMPYVCISIKRRICFSFHALQECFARWIKPPMASLLLGTLADMTRGKAELLAENALLRHQLIILRRQVKRPVYRKTDRLLLVLLARMVRTWKQALFLVQPETRLALASGALRRVLEAQIQGAREKDEALTRDDQLDQGDGSKQPASSERSAFFGGRHTECWLFGTLRAEFATRFRRKR